MKIIKVTLTIFLFSSFLQAQSEKRRPGQDVQRDRNYQPEAVKISNTNSSQKEQVDVSESDTGAQRPVLLKKSGYSYFMGYDSKLFYQSNPLAAPGKLKDEVATGVWKSTFFTGAGLGVIDMDSFILTPYVGFSYSSTDYLKSADLLKKQNFDSTSGYALLLAQFENGWSGKIGVSYSSDYILDTKEEVFKEFYPNISIMKSYTINESHRALFESGVGYHNNFVDGVVRDENNVLDGDDHKRNIDIFASYALESTLGALTISPKYKINYRDYQNGSNKNRNDLVHELSLDCSAYLTNSIKISASIDYINQDDSDDVADYENFDVGGSINLMARF